MGVKYDPASIKVLVYGYVQGVFFRDFVSRRATDLGLTGYVRNLPGGKTVEVRAEGGRDQLKKLIGYLEVGPPTAKVERVLTSWLKYSGDYTGFTIRH